MPGSSKHVHTARVGNVKVPVQKYGDGRYIIRWRQTAGGERIRETFTVKKAACERADEIARAIANSLADVVTLSSADRDSYRLAVQKLSPLGVPLHVAIDEYVAARGKLGGHTLMEAANFFVRGHVERRECPPTSTIITELVAQLRDDRRDVDRYIDPMQRDLVKFANVFPDLQAVTESGVREYLRGLKTLRATRDRETREKIPAGAPLGGRRRDNVRDAIVTLMLFARKREYLPEKRTAAENIRHIAEKEDVTTYSPADLQRILTHFAENDRDWLPWAAIQAFAGPRTSEILRLRWESFHWDAAAGDKLGCIAISAKVARKVRESRQAPILAPLSAWLGDWKGEKGYVIPRKWKDMNAAHSDALTRLRKAMKWEVWDTNALRHSFGSHRLAIVKSIAQVSEEMGNSPQMVRVNYNSPKPEAVAIEYFGVMPKGKGKIIRGEFGAKAS